MYLLLKNITFENTFFKNFSVLTLSNALTQVLVLFISIKIARSLNPVEFGTYNLLLLHVTIFSITGSFGMRHIIIRKIARDRTVITQVFTISLILRAIGSLLTIIFFCAYFYHYKQYDGLFFILVIICLLATILFDLFESLVFGLERMEYSGIINFISSIFWLAPILLVPNTELTLEIIFGLFVLINLLKTVVYYFIIHKKKYIKRLSLRALDKTNFVNFSKECIPYYYLALFTLLSNQIPLLFLEYRSGVEQIGFFNIANKVLMPINLVVSTALAAVFPILSRLFTDNYARFISNVKSIFIVMTLFGIAGAFGITLFRQEIIDLLYGEKYESSSLVLGYQGWYIAVYSVVCLIGTILGAIDKQKRLSVISIVCTIVQVPLLWYGSQYGAEYLSAAFLLATLITLFIHLYVIHSYLKNEISVLFHFKIISLFIAGYIFSLLIPVTSGFYYKTLIYFVLSTVGGIIIYKRYIKNLIKEDK